MDGASVSLIFEADARAVVGTSDEFSRRLEDLQFTLGEGPTIDAARHHAPVLISDLRGHEGGRWPALREATLDQGVRGLFALPVGVAGTIVGALSMFRYRPGALSPRDLAAGMSATAVAASSVKSMVLSPTGGKAFSDGPAGASELASLQRLEVYQATGMIMEALEVKATEALLRLRAYAFVRGLTASEVARALVAREITATNLAWRREDGQ